MEPIVKDPKDTTAAAPALAPATEGDDKAAVKPEGYDAFSIAFAEDAAPTMGDGDAAKKKVEDDAAAATKKAEEEAAAKKAEADAAAGKKAEGDGATKTPEELAAEKKAEDEAAAAEKIKDDAAAAKKAEDEAAAAKKEDEAAAASAQPLKPYEFTDDEKKALAAFEKEWPDISAAQATITRAAMFNGLQYAFSEVHKFYDPIMERFNKLSDVMEDQITLMQLRSGHTDYDTIFPDVEKWVKTLPAAHRRGAEAIIAEGTPEEVVELIGEFKKSKAAPAAPAAPQPKELTEAAKKAAGKLTAVDSKRTVATTAADPDDFDSAWKEFTAEEKKA